MKTKDPLNTNTAGSPEGCSQLRTLRLILGKYSRTQKNTKLLKPKINWGSADFSSLLLKKESLKQDKHWADQTY